MSPIAAMNVAAQITLTPGTVINRLISGDSRASVAISALDCLDLGVEELDLADSGLDRLALFFGELQPCEPGTSLLAERVGERGASDQAAHQDRLDLVLSPRSGPDQLASTLKPPAHHLRFAVGHPDRVERPGREQACQGAGVEAVGLRPGLADPGIGRD